MLQFLKYDEIKYGSKCPSLELDLGVAPLIKVLPGVRIQTHLCFDGHGKKPPIIYFANLNSIKSLEHILKVIDLPLVAIVDPTKAMCICFRTKKPEKIDSEFAGEELIQTCELLFQLASYIRLNHKKLYNI